MNPRILLSSRLRVNSGLIEPEVREAIQIIDSVHLDGDLPLIDLHFQPPHSRAGSYCPRLKEISIDVNAGNLHLSVCHEVGHFLDHQGLFPEHSEKEYYRASEDAEEMREWREAVFQTTAYTSLVTIFNINFDPYIDDLIKERELWARSYAQYVALKSNDPRLLSQLQAVLHQEDPLERFQQWTPDEFLPIIHCIDAIFGRRGWL